MDLQNLSEGQRTCMEGYLVRARESLGRAREIMHNGPRVDALINREEALINLERFHHFSRVLGLTLSQEHHQVLDDYLKFKLVA